MAGFERYCVEAGYWSLVFNSIPGLFVATYGWADSEDTIMGSIFLDSWFSAGFILYHKTNYLSPS